MTQYLPYTKKEFKALLRMELRTYEAAIDDMTADERKNLRKWVADGNSVHDNPFELYEESGCLMDYIEGYRIGEDMLNNPDDYLFGLESALDAQEDEFTF